MAVPTSFDNAPADPAQIITRQERRMDKVREQGERLRVLMALIKKHLERTSL